MDEIEKIVLNLGRVTVRREQLEGRTHVVAPVVMLKQGVFKGSKGPLYYPGDEIAKTPILWDNKPVVVYHPEKNGRPTSAADPVIMTKQKIGVLLNTRYEDKKLKAEAWIDEEKANTVDPRIIKSLDEGKPVEVSTGLYTSNEVASGKDEESGREYTSVARDHKPDHLAVLPDEKGACSIADGAGLLRNSEGVTPVENAMSYNNTHSHLQKQVQQQYGDGLYVRDVYPKFMVYGGYTPDSQIYKHDYVVGKDGKPSITGTPEKIQRVTEYRTMDGGFVGNSLYGVQYPEGDVMAKKELVDALITNSGGTWTETDRAFLESKSEEWLKKVSAAPPAPANNAAAVTAAAQTGAAAVTPVVNSTPGPKTLSEILANSTDPIERQMFADMQASYSSERDQLIKTITANKSNVFTPEFLAAKTTSLEMLRGLAKLAGSPDQNVPMTRSNWSGASGFGSPVVNNLPVPAPLPAPTTAPDKK